MRTILLPLSPTNTALMRGECRHTKPGGWVHITEYEMAIFSDDGTVTPDLQYFQFYEFVGEAAIKTGNHHHIISLARAPPY